ncbi:MAG: DNA-processing protein DprA [Cellvibrionaceae bacterium]
MKNHKTFYTLLLSLLPGVGPSRYWSLVEKFGSAQKVLLSPPDTLPRISPEAKKALHEFQQQGEMSPLACKGFEVLEILEKQQAQLLTHLHDDYPGLLKQTHRPPPVLYAKGNTELLSLPQIAVVGTRNPTNSGIENARIFSRYLAQGGFTITSGFAMGIDAAAHESALAARGKTIGVMATGIDLIYPQRHQAMADMLLEQNGLLITEFAPGTPPHAVNFPRRNRIISGLSLGVLVIEAAVKSGSLITARYATEQNREVFAVPGSIHNPQSKGCHKLIKEGAQLVETGEDIIKQIAGIIRHFADQQTAAAAKPKPSSKPSAVKDVLQSPGRLSKKEKQILESIGYDTLAIEQVIERTGFTSAEVTATLLNLEMKGVVKHSDWGYEAIHEAV